MFLSKIFNLRHIGLLNAFSRSERLFAEETYFNLGYPRLEPPAIRGSMLAIFSDSFLYTNAASIRWGSFFDTGALAFGYFGELGQALAPRCKLHGSKFLALIDDIQNLGHQPVLDFVHLRSNTLVEAVINQCFPNDIQQVRQLCDISDARNNEVCLGGSVTTQSSDILKLYCPNTYINVDAIARLREQDKSKVAIYNPRFGIEATARHADCFDRYL